VLDLRNDPGGLLHGAVGVSAAFLPPKALVIHRRPHRGRQAPFVAIPEDYLRGTPRRLPAGLPPA
jgi:carboxyl-terminal processing protease